MTLIGADVLKDLNKKELRVLQGIEVGMKRAEYVEVDIIAKYAGYSVSETERWLKTCHKMDLVHRWSGHFIGYELTIHGYDALALNALYMQEEVMSIGREKGVGKESRVFFALDNDQREVVIKLHRVGYTSFQHVRKKRRYTANKRHISELYASRLSAEAEIEWLTRANELGLRVPQIYASNRHIIKMELIDGIDLVKLNKLPDPADTLDEIIEFIRACWIKGGFVHGDLSEHNIIMSHDDAKPIVIDFPQSVEKTDDSAYELLERDITNILTYFDRKWGIRVEYEKVLEYVTQE